MLSILLAGCSAPLPPPWTSPYVHATVPWVQDATGAWFLFDTGTPRTQVRTSIGGDPPGERPVPGWSAIALAPDEVVVSDALPPLLLAAEARGDVFGLGGIVGVDLFGGVPTWLDPRAEQLAFVEPPPSTTVVAQADAEVAGGGETCLADGPCVEWGPSRLLIEVEIEGTPITLVLDTAAALVVLTPSALAATGASSSTYRFTDIDPQQIGYGEVRVGSLALPDVSLMQTPDDATTEALTGCRSRSGGRSTGCSARRSSTGTCRGSI